MKTLTVKQPCAYLICLGLKDIENRTWKTNFRGRVLIHASAKPDYDVINTDSEQIYEILSAEDLRFKDDIDAFCAVSSIVGSVEIVDCVRDHPSIWAEKGIWNWVLKNPILFEKPIENVKGKLGFWE